MAKSNLHHAKNLMDFFLSKHVNPLQHLPSNASQELQQALTEQYQEMRNHCDSLQQELSESIQAAGGFIEYDERREAEMRESEEAKAKKVSTLQQEHEKERLERERLLREREEKEQLAAEEAAKAAQEQLDKITEELRINMQAKTLK